MKEIKLWHIDAPEASKRSEAIAISSLEQTDTEKQLEGLLVSSPDLLMPGLILVGRQTPAAGGALDLLGVDEDGALVVFELKRGTLIREAVAQVVDYASYLASLDPDQLGQHISERSGSGGIEKIDNFSSWYGENFPNSLHGISNEPRMVLVGLGADDRTKRMTEFLADVGVDISLITFHAFQTDGQTLLARHVETSATQRKEHVEWKYNKSANLTARDELARKIGSSELLRTIADFLSDSLPAYQSPSRSGYSYSLTDRTEKGTTSNRVYVSIYLFENRQGQAQLVFQRRAVNLVPDAFQDLQRSIAFVEKPHALETWIESVEDWEEKSGLVKEFLDHMIEGWKNRMRSSEEQ